MHRGCAEEEARCSRTRSLVAQDDPRIRPVVRAAQRVRDAEVRLETAREAFYEAVRQAVDKGVSVSALARGLGVSRQAAQRWAKRP